MKPPIKDTPNKGHNRKKTLYKGHTLGPKVPLSYYTSLRRENDLSIKDKIPGPNVSIIWRFHCIRMIKCTYKRLTLFSGFEMDVYAGTKNKLLSGRESAS